MRLGEERLQAQVTELQTGVTALGNTNSTLLAALQTAQSQITTLQTKVAALEAAGSGGAGGASFAKYITVDPNPINGVNGPHLIFTGVNVHIRSGSGVTDDGGNPSGLGNLILGYNEVDPANPAQRNGTDGVRQKYRCPSCGYVYRGEYLNRSRRLCQPMKNSSRTSSE